MDHRTALGEKPSRVALLTDDEQARDTVMASGADLVDIDPALPAARLLALLERSAATEVVITAQLARALAGHPAFDMTDLSALRRVVCDEPLPEAWTGLGAEVVVVGESVDIAADDLVREAERAADDEIAALDTDRAVEAVCAVGEAALVSMMDALRRAGCLDAARTEHEIAAAVSVTPGHRGLLRRWLTVLTDNGLLHRDGDRYRSTTDRAAPDWDRVERLWQEAMGEAATVRYARGCAEQLPGLLSGAADPVLLLFPQGGSELARAVYRESVTARYQHRAVAAFVGGLARRWTRSRPLRVLEIGGGTAATTEVLLPELAGRPVDYLFTDVSQYFLDQARDRFGDRVRYGLLDIDRPVREQGIGQADVIVGGGVLNAAADTDASLAWLAGLLAPGGWLVLTEPTVEECWVMISQAFLMATGPDDDRADSGATFLSLPQWNAALERAGLRRELGLPRVGHPLERLGHRVFAARRPIGKDSTCAE